MSQGFYVTTPIYYVNGDPHIGTAFSTMIADTLARHHRMLGKPTRFTTGTDEHSQKVEDMAKERGISVMKHVDEYSARFQKAWETLGLAPDDFVRTTEERHKKLVVALFTRLKEKGDIYLGKYRGWYCKYDETFYPENKVDIERTKPGHPRPLQFVEEDNWFFRLSSYTDKIRNYYETHPEFVLPRFRRNEVLSMLEQGLDDISVSRKINWGIPIPWDSDQVFYVWVEALMNYLTSIEYGEKGELETTFWPASVQILAKDILRFHGIIWPALLLALEIPLPKTLLTHGYILVDGQKMSKSLGNVQDPMDLASRFSRDALRFSLFREISLGQDGSFDDRILYRRYTTELSNDLGNLVQRIAVIGRKNLPDGLKIPVQRDQELARELTELSEKHLKLMEELHLNQALDVLWSMIVKLNQTVDAKKPWALAKEEKPDALNDCVYEILDSVRFVAHLLAPFLPDTSEVLLTYLQGDKTASFAFIRTNLPNGFLIPQIPILFPRIEDPAKAEEIAKRSKVQSSKKKGPELIEITDFDRIRMEIATIHEARAHPDASKLLVLSLSTSQGRKQVVSGIAEHYKPEELVGKNVVFVRNLKPVELRGILSEGMILAASNRKELSLIGLDKPVLEGSRVS